MSYNEDNFVHLSEASSFHFSPKQTNILLLDRIYFLIRINTFIMDLNTNLSLLSVCLIFLT